MPLRPLSREESRAIDHRAAAIGLSTLVLMENAGRGAAALLRAEIPPPARVTIACGTGNNGGDGAVMARHLDAWGYEVQVVWFPFGGRSSADAATNGDILRAASGVAIEVWSSPRPRGDLDALFAGADWIVDGLFGTGLSRAVEGFARDAIEAMNGSTRPILALDVPSGLDADAGEPRGEAVHAKLTATFVAPKRGFARPGADRYTGRVVVVEIGVPRRLLEGLEARV